MTDAIASRWMNGFALSQWSIECTVVATLLLVGLCCVSFGCRNASSSIRHAVWVTGLIGLLLLPFSLAVLPRARVLPIASTTAAEQQRRSPVVQSREFDRRQTTDGTWNRFPLDDEALRESWISNSTSEPSSQTNSINNESHRAFQPSPPTILRKSFRKSNAWSALALVWFFGTTLLVARLAISAIRLNLIRCKSLDQVNPILRDDLRACQLSLELRSNVRIGVSEQNVVPMAWGILRPSVVFPASILTLSEKQRRPILLHELGHLSRQDPLWHLLTELATALFWFHPLVWYCRHRCAVTRENACDDLVLNQGVEPSMYARCLLEIVSKPFAVSSHQAIGVAMSVSTRIEKRIRCVMNSQANRNPLGICTPVLMSIVMLAGLVPLCVLRADDNTVTTSHEASLRTTKTSIQSTPMESSESAHKPKASQRSNSRLRDAPAEASKGESNEALGDQPNAQIIITGKVIDAQGNPIAGAVLFKDCHSNRTGRVTSRTTADADGAFRLSYERLDAGYFKALLWVFADGHSPRALWMHSLLSPNWSPHEFIVPLKKSEPSSFQILDPEGAPIEAAVVSYDLHKVLGTTLSDGHVSVVESVSAYSSPPDEILDEMGSKTDDSGNVVLGSSDALKIKVRSANYGSQRFLITGKTRVFRLSATGAIRGRVLIDDPNAISGLDVIIENDDLRGTKGIARVKLDGEGKFVVPAIGEGKISLTIPNWNGLLDEHPLWDSKTSPAVVAGETLDLAIKTRRSVLVRGQILTADTRQPVEGAKVALESDESPIRIETHADAHGNFQLRVPSGRVSQHVTSMGKNKQLYQEYDFPQIETITILESTTEIKLRPYLLTPRTVIQGRARDTDGSPIANAKVIFQSREGDFILASALTEVSGRFTTPIQNWERINRDQRGVRQHRWSILHRKRSVNGVQQLIKTPLRVVESSGNKVVLERESVPR